MSDQPTELELLLTRVRAGDNDASRQVVETYGPTILREIRRHLHQPLRTLNDSLDILQEVWRDFFAKRVHRQNFSMEAELIRYLAGMSHNVIRELHRRHMGTQKRDLRRQVPLDSPTVSVESDLVDPQPTLGEVLAREERWNQILQKCQPPVRQALELLRDGHSQMEVATALGVDERMVRRILDKVRQSHGTEQLREAV